MTPGPTPVINLDRDLDGLFQAPFAEFVPARQRLATALKRAGRVDEAEQVRRLAKPTLTAWVANQLFWRHRPQFERFLEAADQVRAVEEALLKGQTPADARQAAARRDRALSELTERGRVVAEREAGGVSQALIGRLRTTLDAIGAYGSGAARHARGRLQQDLDPPGFGAMAALATAAGTPVRRRPRREARRPQPVPPLTLVKKPDPRRTEAEAAVAAAKIEAARRQDAATAAAAAEERARTALETADRKLADAEAAAAEAKGARAAAVRALRQRQTETRKTAAAARAAAAALARARRAFT